jgi:hypothetical protein
MKHSIVAALFFGFVACLPGKSRAQDSLVENPTHATVSAKLIAPDKTAELKTANVRIEVKGIQLVDPASVPGNPVSGQGHLNYRLDGGPVIATASTTLSFHELTSGPHLLTVLLAADDDIPLGPSATLTFTIP